MSTPVASASASVQSRQPWGPDCAAASVLAHVSADVVLHDVAPLLAPGLA